MSPKPTDDEPKGVKCPCGEFTPFTVWVYAHWDERIVFKCPACGLRHEVYRGESAPNPDAKPRKRSKS